MIKSIQSKAFALPRIILIVVILVLAVGARYYFYKPSPEQKEVETVKSEQVIDETANQKTYINEKYQYSFKYPLDCFYGSMPVYCKEKPPQERPLECLCFLDSGNPDRVFLQAYTGEKDNLVLADFSVIHYDIPLYNPPYGTGLVNWLIEKFPQLEGAIPDRPNFEIGRIPAVQIYEPGSAMAYSMDKIYFIKDDKLFTISTLDVDSKSNKELYNQILSTFKFIE